MRTPRGLLATLGVTLSMVAAAACVLFFTSTLVAVNGWPGLSAPPNGGPVALAPVERTVKTTGGSSGSAESPLVLGAPAAPSTPTVQVGVSSTPGATTTPAGTAGDGSERLASGAEPEITGPASTQETTTVSSPVTIGPIPAATEQATTAPAVQAPASTPVSTAAPTATEQTSQTSYKPSERRVALSSPVVEDDAPKADTQVQEQAGVGPQSQARRSFAPTTTTIPAADAPAEEPQAPSTDEDIDSDGGSHPAVEQPAATPRTQTLAQPETEIEKTTSLQPVAETDAQSQEQPAAYEQPAAQEQPAATAPEPEPQADPCPPAADPCPPAAEQPPAPAAETAAPKPPC